MTVIHDEADGRRGSVPSDVGHAGRLKAPDRIEVLLACDGTESENLRAAFSEQAMDVESCADLGSALVLVGRNAPDVIVLGEPAAGTMRPREFLLALRQVDPSTPVIVGLPSPATPDSAVLSAGATVAVRRPFSPQELLRLIDCTEHHGKAFKARPLPVVLGRLRVEGMSPRMWVDGVEFILPPLEFMLLRFLAERSGEFVSRDELVLAGWGDRAPCASNSLSVHMTRLRRKLLDGSGEDWIRSVRGYGYQLVVPAGTAHRRQSTRRGTVVRR